MADKAWKENVLNMLKRIIKESESPESLGELIGSGSDVYGQEKLGGNLGIDAKPIVLTVGKMVAPAAYAVLPATQTKL